MATLAQLHEHYDLKTGSQNRAEKLLDKPSSPFIMALRVFLTQNLFLIRAGSMTKFSKKLKVFFGGLHQIIGAACLLNFFYIQPNRA